MAQLRLVRRMGAFLDSLSLGSGALLIAIVSGVVALATAWLRSRVLRWFAAIVLPLALAYCGYWMPVWLGVPPDQRFSWEFLVVGCWWFAGVITSSIVTFIVARHAKPNA